MKFPVILAVAALAIGTVTVALTVAAPPVAAQSTSDQVATTQTTTFAVENMFCALCPVTVRTAMLRVEGVRSVDIEFDARTATVVFDPSVTNAEAIAAASINAGYPARPGP